VAQPPGAAVTARCGSGQHGWCVGRVYTFSADPAMPRTVDCECGCGCSPRVPVRRSGASRARARQLRDRAARRADRARPRTEG
jgi:hypothetical protein